MWIVWGHQLARAELQASQCVRSHTPSTTLRRGGVGGFPEEQSQGCLLPTGSKSYRGCRRKTNQREEQESRGYHSRKKTRGRGSFTWSELKKEAVLSHPRVGKQIIRQTSQPAVDR